MVLRTSLHYRMIDHTLKTFRNLGQIALIFLAVVSCKAPYTTAELEAHFTKTEIADLKKITDFFLSEICLQQQADFKACFQQSAKGNGFWTTIDFKKQKELYEKLTPSTFEAIWSYCESTYYPSKTKAQSLCANSSGRYQKFLAEVGKQNPRIEKYTRKIQASGDFNGWDIQFWEVQEDPKSFNLNDPNIQLILAIHYLSQNDHSKRNAHLIE